MTNIIVFSFLVGGYHSKNLASDGPKWVAHVIPRFQEQLCVFAKNHGHRLQYAAARTAWLRATRAATAQTTRVPAVKRWSGGESGEVLFCFKEFRGTYYFYIYIYIYIWMKCVDEFWYMLCWYVLIFRLKIAHFLKTNAANREWNAVWPLPWLP